MEKYLIDFTEILKDLFDKKLMGENQSLESLKNLFSDFQRTDILKKRYLSNVIKEIPSTKDFFKIRTFYLPKVTNEQIINYCAANNIDYNTINLNYSPRKNDYSIFFNANKLRNEITKKIQKSDYNETIRILKSKTLDFIELDSNNNFLLHRDHFDEFLSLFKNLNSICWENVSSLTNVSWSENNIEIGKDLWTWNILVSNKAIKWEVDLIIKYLNYLEFDKSALIHLNWTISDIDKIIPFLKELEPYTFFISEKKKIQRLTQDIKFIQGLSGSEFVAWNLELIDHFHSYWDWGRLCANESFAWTIELIDKFIDYIDFKAISSNKNVSWSIELISKYSDKINLEALIKNNSVVWSTAIFEIFKGKVNFGRIAKFSNISTQSIIHFEKMWDQVDTVDNYGKRNSDGLYTFQTTHTLWEYLSKNKNIRWDDILINNYIHKIKIHGFNSSNLFLSVETINKFWEYKKREQTKYWENYDGKIFEEFADIKFRDNIKNVTITDLTFEKFKENEIKWSGILNSRKESNRSIVTLLEGI